MQNTSIFSYPTKFILNTFDWNLDCKFSSEKRPINPKMQKWLICDRRYIVKDSSSTILLFE